jgi:hypothetical protein
MTVITVPVRRPKKSTTNPIAWKQNHRAPSLIRRGEITTIETRNRELAEFPAWGIQYACRVDFTWLSSHAYKRNFFGYLRRRGRFETQGQSSIGMLDLPEARLLYPS